MRIAGAPKCASTPRVVCAFQCGSKSGRGLPSNRPPANRNSCPALPPRSDGGEHAEASPRLAGPTGRNDSTTGTTAAVAAGFQRIGRAAVVFPATASGFRWTRPSTLPLWPVPPSRTSPARIGCGLSSAADSSTPPLGHRALSLTRRCRPSGSPSAASREGGDTPRNLPAKLRSWRMEPGGAYTGRSRRSRPRQKD